MEWVTYHQTIRCVHRIRRLARTERHTARTPIDRFSGVCRRCRSFGARTGTPGDGHGRGRHCEGFCAFTKKLKQKAKRAARSAPKTRNISKRSSFSEVHLRKTQGDTSCTSRHTDSYVECTRLDPCPWTISEGNLRKKAQKRRFVFGKSLVSTASSLHPAASSLVCVLLSIHKQYNTPLLELSIACSAHLLACHTRNSAAPP